MGPWSFVNTFIEEVAEGIGVKQPRPRYAGRSSAASPATGMASRHKTEQEALIDDAFTLGKKRTHRIAAAKEQQEKVNGGKGKPKAAAE